MKATESAAYVAIFTLLMWLPYMTAEFVSNGTMGYLYLDGVWKKMLYDDEKHMRVPMPAWAVRAKAAHRE